MLIEIIGIIWSSNTGIRLVGTVGWQHRVAVTFKKVLRHVIVILELVRGCQEENEKAILQHSLEFV